MKSMYKNKCKEEIINFNFNQNYMMHAGGHLQNEYVDACGNFVFSL